MGLKKRVLSLFSKGGLKKRVGLTQKETLYLKRKAVAGRKTASLGYALLLIAGVFGIFYLAGDDELVAWVLAEASLLFYLGFTYRWRLKKLTFDKALELIGLKRGGNGLSVGKPFVPGYRMSLFEGAKPTRESDAEIGLCIFREKKGFPSPPPIPAETLVLRLKALKPDLKQFTLIDVTNQGTIKLSWLGRGAHYVDLRKWLEPIFQADSLHLETVFSLILKQEWDLETLRTIPGRTFPFESQACLFRLIHDPDRPRQTGVILQEVPDLLHDDFVQLARFLAGETQQTQWALRVDEAVLKLADTYLAKEKDPVRQHLRLGFSFENPDFFRETLLDLEDIDDALAVPHLIACFHQDVMRPQILDVLAHLTDARVCRFFQDLLESGSRAEQKAAVLYLGKHGDGRSIAALRRAGERSMFLSRQLIEEAIQRIRTKNPEYPEEGLLSVVDDLTERGSLSMAGGVGNLSPAPPLTCTE